MTSEINASATPEKKKPTEFVESRNKFISTLTVKLSKYSSRAIFPKLLG